MTPRLVSLLNRATARRARLVALTALLIAPLLATAHAQEDTAEPELVPLSEIARDGIAIEQELAIVGLDAAWRAATGLNQLSRAMVINPNDPAVAPIEQLLSITRSAESSRVLHLQVEAELRETALQLAAAVNTERSRLIDRNRADAHLQGTVALLQSVALDMFAGNGEADEVLLGTDSDALLIAQRTLELRGHTLEEMIERRTLAVAALEEAEQQLADAIARRTALDEDHARLSAETKALARSRNQLMEAARLQLPDAASGFALAFVPRTSNLTVRAMDAYIDAELQMREIKPRCRISWRTIAAVGAVEGAHGTFGGRSLTVDGTPSAEIVGIPLDGSSVDNFGETVAKIPDSDNGRYDGDTRYDRAVGPMQFIPQTWARWAQDGDGDGDFNPQDLDDAALAAGAYLCNYGSMRSWENWKNAIFGYNHSAHYVASVKASLDSVLRVRVPRMENPPELWPAHPYGAYVPMPLPEEELEEGAEGAVAAG